MSLAGTREAELRHLGAEDGSISIEPLAQRIAVLDQVEDLQRRSRNDRRQRVGEEIGPRALPQPVHDLGLCRSVTTGGVAERLAEPAGNAVDPARDAAMFGRAAPMLPTKPTSWLPSTMTIAPYFSARSQTSPRFGDDAHPGEDAVGGDQLEAAAFSTLQLLLQRHHVVGVAERHRLREAHAIDDLGMVQGVGDDRVLLAEQRCERPALASKQDE